MRWRVFSRHRTERGATAVEYALGIALVVVVTVGAVQLLEDESGERLNDEGTTIGQPAGDSRGVLPGGLGSPLPPPSGNTPPSASITSGSCSGRSCFFGGSATDSDGTVTSLSWNFGDGRSATGSSVSNTYPNLGVNQTQGYTVTLTATDDDGDTGTATRSVTCSRGSPPATTQCTTA